MFYSSFSILFWWFRSHAWFRWARARAPLLICLTSRRYISWWNDMCVNNGYFCLQRIRFDNLMMCGWAIPTELRSVEILFGQWIWFNIRHCCCIPAYAKNGKNDANKNECQSQAGVWLKFLVPFGPTKRYFDFEIITWILATRDFGSGNFAIHYNNVECRIDVNHEV